MKKTLLLIPAALALVSSAQATDYGFIDQQNPWTNNTLKEGYPLYFEGSYRLVGSANFSSSDVAGSKLHYSDANAAIYYSFFPSPRNSVALEVGYNYLHLGWDQNPRFSKENFNYLKSSLAWVSYPSDRWRVVLNAGLTVDTATFNVGQTGVGYGLAWARYAVTRTFGLHIGAAGYYGIKHGMILPVLGFDWFINHRFRINGIFPLNYSAIFSMFQNWDLKLEWSNFGGPYKMPRRVTGGSGEYKNGIFSVYSQGIDLSVNYNYRRKVRFALGGGYNFGGWVLIKNSQNNNGSYFDFNGAPYGLTELELVF